MKGVKRCFKTPSSCSGFQYSATLPFPVGANQKSRVDCSDSHHIFLQPVTGDSISWLRPRGDCRRAQAVRILTLTVPVPHLSSSSFLSRRMHGLGLPSGISSFNINSPFIPSSNYSLANWKANCFVCMTWSKDHSEPPLPARGHPRLCPNSNGTENLIPLSVFQDWQYQHYLGAHGKCRLSGLP